VSQENVEVVRRAIAAVNARDIDGYLGYCTDDVELHTPVEPIAGTYDGAEGIKRFFADIEDAGPDFRIDIHGLKAFAADRVLASLHITSTGRSSGVPLENETTNVYDFTEGKINCIRIFLDHDEALKAVGLEE
jgi:ketosteroid isomerase-like protein